MFHSCDLNLQLQTATVCAHQAKKQMQTAQIQIILCMYTVSCRPLLTMIHSIVLIPCIFYSIDTFYGLYNLLVDSEDPDQTVCLFVLRFYGPVNPIRLCRARSVYLTTRLLGRLNPLSG